MTTAWSCRARPLLLLAGYPGVEQLQPKPMEVNWGLFTALGVAWRVSGDQITWVADRDHPDIRTDLPPEHWLGGISGGPLRGLFEGASRLVHHVLSGIIIQVHQELEKVIARRANFVSENGSIIKPPRGL
jgi:hypothetical protein